MMEGITGAHFERPSVLNGLTTLRPQPRYKVLWPKVVGAATNQYTGASEVEREFAIHFAKLKKIESDPALWPVGVDAPSLEAILWARGTLQLLQLEAIIPTRVVASAEGGIAIVFVKRNKYADIEFLNNSEILAVISNRSDNPNAWNIEKDASDIARSALRIRQFLNASTPGTDDTRKPDQR